MQKGRIRIAPLDSHDAPNFANDISAIARTSELGDRRTLQTTELHVYGAAGTRQRLLDEASSLEVTLLRSWHGHPAIAASVNDDA